MGEKTYFVVKRVNDRLEICSKEYKTLEEAIEVAKTEYNAMACATVWG